MTHTVIVARDSNVSYKYGPGKNSHQFVDVRISWNNVGGIKQNVGSDMVIDEYSMEEDKQDVAIITPAESSEEPESEPSADDCKLASPPAVRKLL